MDTRSEATDRNHIVRITLPWAVDVEYARPRHSTVPDSCSTPVDIARTSKTGNNTYLRKSG